MESRKVEYKECREQRGDCWVCPLQPVNRDWIGLNPTIVPLIGPLIGRAHANLGWSPQTHDAIYKTKGSQERLTLVPRPKTLVLRGPHHLVSECLETRQPTAARISMPAAYLQCDGMKIAATTTRCVSPFLSVDN